MALEEQENTPPPLPLQKHPVDLAAAQRNMTVIDVHVVQLSGWRQKQTKTSLCAIAIFQEDV